MRKMSVMAVVSWLNVDTALRPFQRVAAAQPEQTQQWACHVWRIAVARPPDS